MKYNWNINYIKCMEYWLTLSQWAVMDIIWHISLWATITKENNWIIYYYLSAWKLVEELPIISNKKNTFLVILKELKNKELIQSIFEDNKSFYSLTQKGKSFFISVEWNQEEVLNEIKGGLEWNQDNNNTTYNTTSDNNIILDKSNIIEQSSKVVEYWNKEINKWLEFLKQAVWVSDFKENRKMQWMRMKNIQQLTTNIWKEEFLIRLKHILQDDFKAKNCNSITYLYRELKAFIHSPIVPTEPKGVKITRV